MAQDTSGNKKIAIIGCGHIGTALRRGLLRSGVSQSRIAASNSAAHNMRAAKFGDYIFLAVRPGVVPGVLEQIKDAARGKLVISLAAAGSFTPVRIMPNLPMAHGHGVIGIYARRTVPRARVAELKKLLSGMGLVVECSTEEDLNTLTLMSASGVGIAAYLMGMLADYGAGRGLGFRESQRIAAAVFSGAIGCLKEDKADIAEFIQAVATTGGTTEAVISELENMQYGKKFMKAMKKGEFRIKERTRELTG